MSIKDTIIDLLKEVNAQQRNKVELLKKKLLEVEISRNKLEQYTRRNNIEIQGILSKIADEKLEDKVTEIFGVMNIAIIAIRMMLRIVTDLAKVQKVLLSGL